MLKCGDWFTAFLGATVPNHTIVDCCQSWLKRKLGKTGPLPRKSHDVRLIKKTCSKKLRAGLVKVL